MFGVIDIECECVGLLFIYLIYIYMLDIYTNNVERKLSELNAIVNDGIGITKGNESECINDVSNMIKDVEKQVKNLDIEITMNNANGSIYADKLKLFKLTLNRLKDNFKAMKVNYELSKRQYNYNESLLSSSGNGNNDDDVNENVALNSLNKLQMVNRTTIEMESMSNDIIHDLSNQSDQMKNINKTLHNMGDTLDSSNDVLSSMLQLNSRNKRIVIAFGLVFVCIFVVVFWIRVVNRRKEGE
jgi:hypothetical protein